MAVKSGREVLLLKEVLYVHVLYLDCINCDMVL